MFPSWKIPRAQPGEPGRSHSAKTASTFGAQGGRAAGTACALAKAPQAHSSAASAAPMNSRVVRHAMVTSRAECYFLTTVMVTCDGNCFEWCTTLCATTPVSSS